VDSLESHRQFAERLGGIPFPMLSDEEMRVIRMYGVVHDEGIKARRSVFVLNKDGVITYTNTHYNVHDLTDYEALMDALQEA
jgi:peroxiredoxin